MATLRSEPVEPEPRSAPRAPAGLGATARHLWHATCENYQLEAHHLVLLEQAARAIDRLEEARAAIERDGAYPQGLHGPVAHPAVAVERDSRIAVARLLRELGLDNPIEPPRPPVRGRSH